MGYVRNTEDTRYGVTCVSLARASSHTCRASLRLSPARRRARAVSLSRRLQLALARRIANNDK